jgi:hypothetical protein
MYNFMYVCRVQWATGADDKQKAVQRALLEVSKSAPVYTLTHTHKQ